MKKKIIFLTGKLAYPALLKVLEENPSDKFDYDVVEIGVSVAALATIDIIANKFIPNDLKNVDKIIIPGRCKGDIEKLKTLYNNINVQRGPDELKDLPKFLGLEGKDVELLDYETQIIAEITDAPQLTIPKIIKRAEYYKKNGANYIDIGCIPGTKFPHLEETIQELKANNFKVSIDSLNSKDIMRGIKSGVNLILSLQKDTLWILDETDAKAVVIPDHPKEENEFYETIASIRSQNKNFIADPILEPINFGFSDSIYRYKKLRMNFPDIDIMLGVGNLTELTHCDSIGTNAMLFGIAQELKIKYALCTEVSEHCRNAIKEADISRKFMYKSYEYKMPPKELSSELLSLRDIKPFPYSTEELKDMAKDVKDKNYRIYVNNDGIHVFNNKSYIIEKNPADIYPKLDIKNDDGHAYYLGMELSRAHISFILGKRYEQDEYLKWGCSVEIDDEDQLNFKTAGHTMRGLNKKK